MPFLRAGWTKDGGSVLDRSVSAGFGYQTFEGGTSWAPPLIVSLDVSTSSEKNRLARGAVPLRRGATRRRIVMR